MFGIHRAAVVLLFGVSVSLMAGCQAVSTGDGYKPANCAMVGSRCSRDR
jgi:hypothetical protein